MLSGSRWLARTVAILVWVRSSQAGTCLSPAMLAGFAGDLTPQQAGTTLLTCFSIC